MVRKHKLLFALFLVAWFVIILVFYLHQSNFEVLNPKGVIAAKQKNLIIFTILLSLIVVVPVYVMTFYIAWKYREGNKRAKYNPDWDHSKLIESIWWAVPLLLISILSVITWQSSHQLDPFKPLQSVDRPLNVQVVALQWRWLFIYPDQHLASLNYLPLPVNRPINFQLTSDGPMNSFWVPQLGSQVYAMSGMATELHLMATAPGDYNGSSANISGSGFANMKFDAQVLPQADFARWMNSAKKDEKVLDDSMYGKLSQPSLNSSRDTYGTVEQNLFDQIIMKYTMPGSPLPPVVHKTNENFGAVD